jgi:polysaccharide deacetylase 2 family uncharacterized protein YibQ
VRKKRSRARRGGTSAVVTIAVLVLVAAAGGWWLLTPRAGHTTRTVARITPQPSIELASAAPSETPSPPIATPTAAVTPTPIPSATTPPRPSSSPERALPAAGGPRLALIVDDCGQWIDTERGFVALGVPLTLSVLPDVRYTATIAREASVAGKGVMLHLPMETLSGLNPGPGKITTEMTDAQIAAQVEDDLAQVPLAQGVNNHEGSKGSADPRVMSDVIGVLAKRGNLFFVDSRTNAASVGESTARAQGVPTAARDVFLDNQATVAYTVARLREAAAIAKRTGSAIAIGHPRPTTLRAVEEMIPELQADGIQLVLARDLVSPER